MTITICDICGKQTEKSTEPLVVYKFAISSHGRVWDICDDCRESLNRCIDIRKAVIQIIENKLNPCTDMFKCLEMSEIKEDVERLPSVTPRTVTEFADKCKECGKIKEDLYDKGFEAGKHYIVDKMCALLEKEVEDEKTE